MIPRTLPPSLNQRVVDAKHPFHHYMKLQLRFADFDMFGHVNNNAYLSLFDTAKIDYFTQVMDGTLDFKADITLLVVNVNCDFLAPTLAGQEVEAYTQVTVVGEKSVTLEQRIVDAATLQPHAICRTILASFNPATGQSALVDPRWVEALSRFENREF